MSIHLAGDQPRLYHNLAVQLQVKLATLVLQVPSKCRGLLVILMQVTFSPNHFFRARLFMALVATLDFGRARILESTSASFLAWA